MRCVRVSCVAHLLTGGHMLGSAVGRGVRIPPFAASAIMWVLASAVAATTQQSATGLAAVYLPVGLAVAFMLRMPDARWAIALGVPVGSLVVAAVSGGDLLPALLGGCANAVEALAATAILTRLGAQRFGRPVDALSLAVAAVAAAGVGAVLGAAAAAFSIEQDAVATLQTWFAADAVAIVLLVPLLAVVRFTRAPARRVVAYVALFVAAAVLGVVVVRGEDLIGGIGVFLAWYALLMVVMLAGVRLGVTGLGLVQVPAAVAAFASLDDLPSGEWIVRQGITGVVSVTMLGVVLTIRETMRRSERSEQLARDMLDMSPVPMARVRASAARSSAAEGVVERAFTLTDANPAWSRLLGVEEEAVEASDFSRYVHPADVHLLRDVFTSDGRVSTDRIDLRMVRRGGEDVVAQVVAVPVGGPERDRLQDDYVVALEDVTAQRHSGRLLEHKARTDSLTGLLNRGAILNEISRRISQASPGHEIGIMFVDLDGFKQVNDTHGHSAGDHVLREVSRRLQGALRPRDLVGRVGGDEFVVVAEVNDEAELPVLAARVKAAVSGSIGAGGGEMTYGASVGWSMVLAGDSEDTVVGRADAAMYRSKPARLAFLDPGA